jgi:hypothetical protein
MGQSINLKSERNLSLHEPGWEKKSIFYSKIDDNISLLQDEIAWFFNLRGQGDSLNEG